MPGVQRLWNRGRCQSELTRDIIQRMARTAAPMTRAEFRQLFRIRFNREYNDLQPPWMFSPEERELVEAYVVAGYVLDQVTYCDPKTNLTYEVFYDFDYDAGQAIVAYALLDGKKVRLNRGLTADGAGRL